MPQASYATRRGVKTPRRDQTQQRPLSVAAPRPGEPSIFGARFYLTRGWVEQRPARSSSSIGAQLLAIAEAPISQPPTPALQTLHAEALSAPPRTPSTPRPFTPRPQATPLRDLAHAASDALGDRGCSLRRAPWAGAVPPEAVSSLTHVSGPYTEKLERAMGFEPTTLTLAT